MTSSRWDALASSIASAGLEAGRDVPLAPHTTYQVGGAARLAVRLRSSDEAQRLASVLSSHVDLPMIVVGRGSNMLVADGGFDGLAVFVAQMSPDSVTVDDAVVTASGGVPLPVLARRSVGAGRCGLEWAVGVPGSVGGGIRMNAGGHGADIADSLVDAEIISLRSGRRAVVSAAALDLHFRGSALADHHLVVAARFLTTEGDCQSALTDIVAWRREHQPGGRNAGSVFVNPAAGEGSAGAIIDSLGLRGLRVGGAEVSTKHANFIVADDGARASDVFDLMCAIHDAVEDRAGVSLRSEVRLVGFERETSMRFVDDSHLGGRHDEARAALAATMGDL